MSISFSPVPEIILENHYGSHQPCVFCENYILNLAEQALDCEAQIIMKADHATDVLYNGSDKEELDKLSGVEVADLLEKACWAWDTILQNFVPEEGYHLDYLDNDQALWMIPDGWEQAQEDCAE